MDSLALIPLIHQETDIKVLLPFKKKICVIDVKFD